MVTDMVLFVSRDPNSVRFLFLWLCEESSFEKKRKTDTRNEYLARIWDAAARTKESENQLIRTTHDLHTRVAKFTEPDGGIFECSF